jgi:hypothetical protein
VGKRSSLGGTFKQSSTCGDGEGTKWGGFEHLRNVAHPSGSQSSTLEAPKFLHREGAVEGKPSHSPRLLISNMLVRGDASGRSYHRPTI